jgi:hypothetical protein
VEFVIPWRWFFAAFAVGEGLKFSGVFNRQELDRHDEEYKPRVRGQKTELPFNDNVDFGE